MAYPRERLAPWLVALVLLAGSAVPLSAQVEKTCTHVYVDESGTDVCASSWNEIPERFRTTARPVDPRAADDGDDGMLLWSNGGLSGKDSLNTIYRFENRNGRECFTNIWDQVPAESRKKAEVIDLSHVTLNTAVGREIDSRLEEQHRALIGSDYCQLALEEEGKRWWFRAWNEFKPLVIAAGIILLLLMATPFALRRVNAPQWSRTLTTAIQMISLFALFVFVVMKMNDVRQNVRSMAAPCTLDSWKEAGEAPNAVARHAEILRTLNQRIREFEQQGVMAKEREGLVP